MMAVNHERQKVWAEVTTVDLDYATLAEAITKLQGYCVQYGDTARIQIRDRDAEQAIRDRAEFERLKAKFGG